MVLQYEDLLGRCNVLVDSDCSMAISKVMNVCVQIIANVYLCNVRGYIQSLYLPNLSAVVLD